MADQAKAQIYRVLGRKYRFDPDDERALGDLGHPREPAHHRQHRPRASRSSWASSAALTLFVGGMGVANIMYAVVKERTREIGVKMALGAKVRQVMAPFVLEALLMTVSAASLGTLVSLGLHGRASPSCP